MKQTKVAQGRTVSYFFSNSCFIETENEMTDRITRN